MLLLGFGNTVSQMILKVKAGIKDHSKEHHQIFNLEINNSLKLNSKSRDSLTLIVTEQGMDPGVEN